MPYYSYTIQSQYDPQDLKLSLSFISTRQMLHFYHSYRNSIIPGSAFIDASIAPSDEIDQPTPHHQELALRMGAHRVYLINLPRDILHTEKQGDDLNALAVSQRIWNDLSNVGVVTRVWISGNNVVVNFLDVRSALRAISQLSLSAKGRRNLLAAYAPIGFCFARNAPHELIRHRQCRFRVLDGVSQLCISPRLPVSVLEADWK
ncbi:hypothetical protein PM082_010802 [Marasmius tenuissimus]|nr:hypothetical protein PM082_010802 [Marasmius tenuissimus]